MEIVKLIELPILEKEIETESLILGEKLKKEKYCLTHIKSLTGVLIFWIDLKYYDKLKESLKDKTYIEGVFRNATFSRGKAHGIIEEGNNNIFFVMIRCGYRGGSKIDVLSEHVKIIEYKYYHSKRCFNLGTSTIAIIETPKDYIKFKWQRDGHLYNEPSNGISTIKIDGTIETITDTESKPIDKIIEK
jgi:hypothetical protein